MFSLTAMLFIFEACYGTPMDMEPDIMLQGVVKSSATSQPIEGIQVSIDNLELSFVTDQDGRFSFYAPYQASYDFSFIDGAHQIKDTSIMKKEFNQPIEILLEQE